MSFKLVQLKKKDVLGKGAYGAVCTAQCDELMCAAKIIHPTLITDDPGDKSPQGRFRTECEFLSTLRHPNVVQYLGTWLDPDTDRPVLLMELLDGNLTSFLENSAKISFHTQVNICHDIAMALSFLHSHKIIHRDLSSNNILMIGDRRAKVTDFGMASFQSTRMKVTVCPGTEVYMPPEAVREAALYTEKIDCFSFGVLVVQILTRRFPSPKDRYKTVTIGGKELLEPQPELTRREDDIRQVEDQEHPLLLIAKNCLRDKEENRPAAREICLIIADLKHQERYTDCPKRNEELVILKAELDQLKLVMEEKDFVIEELEASIEDKIAENRFLFDKLHEAQRIKEKELPFRKDTDFFGGGGGGGGGGRGVAKNSLYWKKCVDSPCHMIRYSDAVVCGSFMYVRADTDQTLYIYNWEAGSWSEGPHCPTTYCTLANVKNTLVVIGGFLQDGSKTNKLFNLSIARKEFVWRESYPPMPTPRDSTIATSYGTYLIVAGGVGDVCLRAVEVLHVDTKQWYAASSLPLQMYSASASICDNELYIFGGCAEVNSITYSILTCSIRNLIGSCRKSGSKDTEGGREKEEKVWSYCPLLPVTRSTSISFRNQLLAVGGQNRAGDPSKGILGYDVASKSWVECGQLVEARSQCHAAVLPNDELMVVGGFTGKNFTEGTDTCEVAIYRVTTT